MSSSLNIALDGVEFKLSDAFRVNSIVELPHHLNIKDPCAILKNCEYDFSYEHNLIAVHLEHEKEIKENQKREQEKKEDLKRELVEKHRLFLLQKQKEAMKMQEKNATENESKQLKFSPNNPFLNMISSDILTPQKYSNDKHDTPHRHNLDVHEFESENQDPFSNMELQSIDDLKELKDVLQNVTMSTTVETTNASTTCKPSPRVRHHSPTNKNPEVTVKVIKRDEKRENDAGTSKEIVMDDLPHSPALDTAVLRDLSKTSPEENIEREKSVIPLPRSSPHHETTLLPSITFASNMPSVADTSVSSSSISISADYPSLVPNNKTTVNSDLNNNLGSNGVAEANETISSSGIDIKQPIIVSKNTDIGSKSQNSSEPNNCTEPEYENIPVTNKPSAAPKPLPRAHREAIATKPSMSDNSLYINANQPSTYGAVRNKVLANKSMAERTKFEETINKALTSLPQLPKMQVKKANQQLPKPHSSGSNMATKSSSTGSNSSILSGLSQAERNFVHSIVVMGFKEQDVIRTMQKYGEDHKEVLDHLFKVQCLSEKGFSTECTEEALSLFDGNEEEAAKYLTLERQFLDMGFSCDRIKQALLLHDRDQTKALEELMSGV